MNRDLEAGSGPLRLRVEEPEAGVSLPAPRASSAAPHSVIGATKSAPATSEPAVNGTHLHLASEAPAAEARANGVLASSVAAEASILQLPSEAEMAPLPGTSRHRRSRWMIAGLGVALVLVSIAAAGIGAVWVSPAEVATVIGGRLGLVDASAVDPGVDAILTVIRFPRVVLGILVGAAISLCGVLLQGLFRNPLADPGLLGISSGAALAAAAVTVLGPALGPVVGTLGNVALPVMAFAGALAATALVKRIATTRGRTEVTTLLLGGVALTSMAEAGTGLFTFLSTENQLRSLTNWRMGSLGGATWMASAWIALPIAVLFAASRSFGRSLDALLLGEREAAHLGVDVESLKRKVVFLVAIAVGAAVAASGVIGFVGLVVPNLMRLAIGPGHRHLLPASALGGAVLVLGADLVARTAIAPAELPIGVVTAAIGAPFFIFLLIRHKRRISE